MNWSHWFDVFCRKRGKHCVWITTLISLATLLLSAFSSRVRLRTFYSFPKPCMAVNLLLQRTRAERVSGFAITKLTGSLLNELLYNELAFPKASQ